MEMHDYVEKLVQYYSNWPDIKIGSSSQTVPDVAEVLKHTQFFDCTQISEYAYHASYKEYAELDIPPSADTILPAPMVGLFLDLGHKKPTRDTHEPDAMLENKGQNLLLCLPLAPKKKGEIITERAAHKNGKPIVGMVEVEDEDEIEFPRLHYKNFAVLSCYLSPNTMPHPIGTIECETIAGIDVSRFLLDINVATQQSKERNDADHTWLRHAATFLHLINKPRFVKKSSPLSRQRRRGLHRGMGFAVDAWHRVSWNVDKPVAAKEPYDTTFHKMPLHFNRGHWKSAKQHHPKSILRNDEWKTWIEGYWAGHPAFGFKKQYWQPKKGAA